MNDTVNRQILLVEKPTGKLGPEHFRLTKGTVPVPKDGEALVRTRYISLDAANRADGRCFVGCSVARTDAYEYLSQ